MSDREREAKGGFERRKEQFIRQLIADPAILLSDLKVAIAITCYWNRKTGYAFPSYARLEKDTSLPRRTIMRAAKRLAALGHYLVVHKASGKRRYANEYHPVLQRAPEGVTT